jgi:hypothetical protein
VDELVEEEADPGRTCVGGFCPSIIRCVGTKGSSLCKRGDRLYRRQVRLVSASNQNGRRGLLPSGDASLGVGMVMCVPADEGRRARADPFTANGFRGGGKYLGVMTEPEVIVPGEVDYAPAVVEIDVGRVDTPDDAARAQEMVAPERLQLGAESFSKDGGLFPLGSGVGPGVGRIRM